MTAKTRANFKTDKDTAFADNTAGDIGADDLRAQMDHLADSALFPEDAVPSHNHAAGDLTSGTLADARVAQSNVTQHQAALSITESQISDLGSYIESVEGTAVLSTGETGGSKFLREDGDGTSSWQAIPGGGDALTGSPLSQFAATTSAQLAGVISDETGSGALVFGTSPSLTTPNLGTPSAVNLTNATELPIGGIASAAKSGSDATLVTGTAGTTDQIAVWNADGDLVGATAGTIAGLTEKETPATGDWLVLSDSAASGTLKKVNWSSLPSGGGTVDTSGTPVANDFARFTDADTIEGRSYSEVRSDLGLVIGTDVQAYDANLPTWPSTVNATEVGYLDGVTSAIQTQLNGKLTDVVDDTTPTLGGDLDGAGNEVANYTNSVVTSVSGTLTTAAHAGNVIVTSGNVTVPTTAGFTCIIIAGGAHTVTFNSTTSAAMAAGDIMTVAVESGTVIHAVLTAAADKVTFT